MSRALQQRFATIIFVIASVFLVWQSVAYCAQTPIASNSLDDDENDDEPSAQEIERHNSLNREAASELKELYDDINRFRYNPSFHKWGFGERGPFHWWADKLKRFRDKWVGYETKNPKEIDVEIIAAFAKLDLQGYQFFDTEGRGDKYAPDDEAVIQRAIERYTDHP